MALLRVSFGLLAIIAFIFSIVLPAAAAQAQSSALAPAPAPSNDGTSIDQGIAYVLMLLALVLTYIIHPLDASGYYILF